MELIYKYIIYYFAGLLISLISTISVKSVSKSKAALAGVSSFTSVLISTYVVLDIISNMTSVGTIAILLYALGFGTGSYIITKYVLKK